MNNYIKLNHIIISNLTKDIPFYLKNKLLALKANDIKKVLDSIKQELKYVNPKIEVLIDVLIASSSLKQGINDDELDLLLDNFLKKYYKRIFSKTKILHFYMSIVFASIFHFFWYLFVGSLGNLLSLIPLLSIGPLVYFLIPIILPIDPNHSSIIAILKKDIIHFKKNKISKENVSSNYISKGVNQNDSSRQERLRKRLEEIEILKNDGIINQDEYKVKRKQIINDF